MLLIVPLVENVERYSNLDLTLLFIVMIVAPRIVSFAENHFTDVHKKIGSPHFVLPNVLINGKNRLKELHNIGNKN